MNDTKSITECVESTGQSVVQLELLASTLGIKVAELNDYFRNKDEKIVRLKAEVRRLRDEVSDKATSESSMLQEAAHMLTTVENERQALEQSLKESREELSRSQQTIVSQDQQIIVLRHQLEAKQEIVSERAQQIALLQPLVAENASLRDEKATRDKALLKAEQEVKHLSSMLQEAALRSGQHEEDMKQIVHALDGNNAVMRKLQTKLDEESQERIELHQKNIQLEASLQALRIASERLLADRTPQESQSNASQQELQELQRLNQKLVDQERNSERTKELLRQSEELNNDLRLSLQRAADKVQEAQDYKIHTKSELELQQQQINALEQQLELKTDDLTAMQRLLSAMEEKAKADISQLRLEIDELTDQQQALLSVNSQLNKETADASDWRTKFEDVAQRTQGLNQEMSSLRNRLSSADEALLNKQLVIDEWVQKSQSFIQTLHASLSLPEHDNLCDLQTIDESHRLVVDAVNQIKSELTASSTALEEMQRNVDKAHHENFIDTHNQSSKDIQLELQAVRNELSIKELRLTELLLELQSCQQQVSHLQAEAIALESSAMDEKRKVAAQVEEQRERDYRALEELRCDLRAARELISSLTDESQSLKRQLAEAAEIKNRWDQQLSQVESERDKAQEDSLLLTKELQLLQEEMRRRSAETSVIIDRLQTQKETLESSVATAHAETQSSLELVKTLRQSLTASEEQYIRCQDELQEVNDRLCVERQSHASVSQQCTSLTDANTKLTEKLNLATSSLLSSNEEVNQLIEDKKTLEVKLLFAQKQRDKKELDLASSIAMKDSLQEKLNELQTQHASLQEEITRLTAQIDLAKTQQENSELDNKWQSRDPIVENQSSEHEIVRAIDRDPGNSEDEASVIASEDHEKESTSAAPDSMESDWMNTITELKAANISLDTRNKELQLQVEQLQVEIQSLSTKLAFSKKISKNKTDQASKLLLEKQHLEGQLSRSLSMPDLNAVLDATDEDSIPAVSPKFDALQSQLTSLLHEQKTWSQSQQKIDELQSQNKELQDQCTHWRMEVDRIISECSAVQHNSRLNSIESAVGQSDGENSQDSLQALLKTQSESLHDLEIENRKLSYEISGLQAAKALIQKERDALKLVVASNNDQRRLAWCQMTSRVDELQTQLASQTSALQSCQVELMETKRNLANAQFALTSSELKVHADDATSSVAAESEQESSKVAVNLMSMQLNDIRNELNTVQSRSDSLSLQCETLREVNESLSRQRDKLSADVVVFTNELFAVKQQVILLKQESHDAEVLRLQLEREVERARKMVSSQQLYFDEHVKPELALYGLNVSSFSEAMDALCGHPHAPQADLSGFSYPILATLQASYDAAVKELNELKASNRSARINRSQSDSHCTHEEFDHSKLDDPEYLLEQLIKYKTSYALVTDELDKMKHQQMLKRTQSRSELVPMSDVSKHSSASSVQTMDSSNNSKRTAQSTESGGQKTIRRVRSLFDAPRDLFYGTTGQK